MFIVLFVMICIDASRFGHLEPTGVEVYSNYLLPRLVARAERDHIPLQLLAPLPKDISSAYAKPVVIPGKRLWTYLHLSLYLFRERHRVDTLFVPSHVLPFVLPKKSVITIHDLAFRRLPESYSWGQRLLLHFAAKRAVRHASQIICISESTRKDLEKFYGCPKEKLRLIPLGFDREAFLASFVVRPRSFLDKWGLVPEKYFLYIGRIEEKKNIAHLVRAFLQTKDTGWKLVLVGKPGVGFPLIAELLDSPEAKRRIIHTGYLPADDAYSLLAYAGTFVFPSRFEGFGIPVLEAQALDVPVVCSRAGALPEVAGNAALYMDNTEGSLIRLLEGVQTPDFARQDYIAAGRENIARFSWERCAEEVWSTLT